MATSQSLLVGRHNSLPVSWKISASEILLTPYFSKSKRGWKHNIPSSMQPLNGNRLVIFSSVHKNIPPFIRASMYRCQIGSPGEHSRHSPNRIVSTARRRLTKDVFQIFKGDAKGAECEGKVERQLHLIAQCIIFSLLGLLGGFDTFTITNWVVEAAPVPTHALELNVQDDVKLSTNFSSPHLANQPVDTGSRFSATELDVSQSQMGYIDSGARQSNVLLGCPVRSRKAPLSVLLRYPRGFQDNQGPEIQIPNSGFLREGVGESMEISYGQIVAARDDTNQRRSMYTKDAWMGMRRLQQYGRLVDSMEPKEKVCLECTRNRRYDLCVTGAGLANSLQCISSNLTTQCLYPARQQVITYDSKSKVLKTISLSFSQSQWAGELYRTLSKAGGVLRTKAETYRAVKEMVSHLGDKYSSFLNSEEYRLAIHHPLPSEIKYLAYQYTGVGLELGTRSSNGGFAVVAPLAGSPAEEAGILGGEQLVAVDNLPMESLTRDEAIALLRGPVGSTVELSVSGENTAQPPRSVSLDRRALPLPPLRMRILDSGNGQAVAYLRLHYFTHEGTKKMAAAIREGEALGVDGYILDLRNNPGGVFEEAIAMAALWLDCNGCDVTETVRSNAANIEDLVYSVGNLPKDVFLKHPGVLTHAPLAIITNRDSASASEVLTGALHDNHRVFTVGERTFGKGVVQYFFPMDDGSGLKLTVAKYLTPARYDISKQGGLEPDKACSDYPHGGSASDKCIEEALGMLSNTITRSSAPSAAPMPYRWLPLTQRRLWASGSY